MQTNLHIIEKCDNVCILTIPGRKEVGPYVECLIGQLEEAQDAVSCRAARVAIARDDAVLMEHLEIKPYYLLLANTQYTNSFGE